MSASQTRIIVTAARSFLATFDASDRPHVQFPFVAEKTARLARFRRTAPGAPAKPVTDAGAKLPAAHGPGMGPPGGFIGEQYGQSIRSNYPVSDVPRPGLQLGHLTAAQQDATMHLLQMLLSRKGYEKVLDIMGGDQALADSGTPFASGKAVYTIAIFGAPSEQAPWMVQFGGHHLGLNIVMDGAHGTMTPTLTGAQPAVYQADGKTIRVLAAENDKAFALLDAFDTAQRRKAILPYTVDDLVMGPGHDGETIVPEGLKGSSMTSRQKQLMLDLIGEWAGIINDAYAAPRLQEIRQDLDETWFAWSGPTTHAPGRNGSSYYRIQGPRLLIEFSPQGVGGDPTMHVHTVYRDPTDNYGTRYTTP
ncbi:hypothetical protein Tasa_017_032 [Tanticharoenia sakaeratensis NBRC 103193]|uniref:DUF3500 domain-containing protein n=2 Tax=Tanticharoenia TaxID=444052 RepID=A0A0D6MKE6_9PROT|nr:DUF3500 domain-containing protein [Tanticharoenia sakaeratensis]GAN54149.1 hypothetical protein Tasa_017_032 [Tanticharoenia sakaeratensis NBRC 103193]GBQ19455.1 hypothetical protein AA103193_1034 [Tanticharoenia sakaeratensis NBRC 103193]